MAGIIDPEQEHGPDGVSGMIRDFTRRHGFTSPPKLPGVPEKQTVGFIGRYGAVEVINCTALPEEEVVFDGNLLIVAPADVLEDWVPDSCPRRPNPDISGELGCLSCGHSIIKYINGVTEF